MAMADYGRVELTWVLRPSVTRPSHVQALAGRLIHATSPVDPDSQTEVVLEDGTHLRVTPAEIVPDVPSRRP